MAKLRVSWEFFIGLATALLLLPLKWVAAWIVAVALHEGCHCLAVYLLGGRIDGMRIGLFGASMTVSPMSYQKEALAAAAGPMCILLILPFVKHIPRVAICVFLQTVFNLLPLLPLDGGRICRCLFILLRRGSAFQGFQKAVVAVLGVVAVVACFRLAFGGMPIILFALLYSRNRKSSCNQKGKRVQ